MLKNVKSFIKKITDIAIKVLVWIKNVLNAIVRVNLSHNTGKKLFSVMLAIMFWIFVMDQVDPPTTRMFENVPVQLINLQELDQNNLVIMNQYDYLVNVEVSGRRSNILNLNSKAIYLWADMRTVRSGTNNVTINRTINSESVTIKSVLPNEIVIMAERVIALPKPVRILMNDRFGAGYYQEGIVITPEEIKVMGPESLVNSVAYLGAYINVGSLVEDLQREVTLVPYSADGEIVSGVTLESSYANMHLKLGKSETVNIVTETIGDPLDGYQIVSVKTIPERVELTGPIDQLNALGKTIFETIKLNGDEMTSFIIEKDLVLPAGVTAVGLTTPLQIEVIIEEIQTKEFIFNASEIPVVNLSDDFTTNLFMSEEIVTVKITDVESKIALLTKSDIRIDLNFTYVERAGNYRMKVNVSTDLDYFALDILPPYVELIVEEKNESNP